MVTNWEFLWYLKEKMNSLFDFPDLFIIENNIVIFIYEQ